MISQLGYLAQRKGTQIFFHAQTDEGSLSFSYQQTRLAAAALARELANRGIKRGGYAVCNLYNGPEFVFLALAAAYGGFTLAVLNPRLSEAERNLRKVELESATGCGAIEVLTEKSIRRILIDGLGYSIQDLAQDQGVISASLSVQDTLYYAQEREESFDPKSCGIVMFTSGTSGTPKATMLPWSSIAGSAAAANKLLIKPNKGVWQLVLPMCHIGGFQIMVRSLLNGNPFVLYSRYQPARILNDALTFKVTHISVVDKILSDLLEQDHDRIISQYVCILLGGAALNSNTTRKALRARANVYVSYGMTETSSLIACAPLMRGFTGAMHLLPGYEVRIMRPNAQGVGQLHVKGPGVFTGYLNARHSSSADGWLVTGDRASVDRRKNLYVYERVEDLIISGGENIYPAEVREALLKVPGIKDACVFGTADETWGYRPVAFVEADYSAEALARDHAELGLSENSTNIKPASCPQEFARMVHAYLEPRMSHLHHPKHILVLDTFPRTAASKTDVVALKKLYDCRIDIKSVTLFRTKQPFVVPVKTAKGQVHDRESFFVEVKDWAGRTGIAECVSFATNWYLPETLDQDYEVVKNGLVRVITSERYLHPSEVSRSLATMPAYAAYPMAKAAIEPAIWDLYGKITGQPLRQLIGGNVETTQVLGGVVIGIKSTDETLAAVDEAVSAGYSRVKIKISPESAVEKVAAVREKYPELSIFLDANQSFTEEQLDTLTAFDELNITCIEEPLKPDYVPATGETNLFERLSALQVLIKTPICLDESVVSAADMEQAMSLTNLRCYAVKIAKFGGIQPALDFCAWAQENKVQVWMGGMFDTGVSKRMHAAFGALDSITLPGDISDYSNYFNDDCAYPPLVLEEGKLLINKSGYEAGLGCVLNEKYLEQISIETVTITK